jgi:hypothetical protein
MDFTFRNFSVTAFHDPAASSTVLEVGIGWFDVDGNIHYFLNSSTPLAAGSTRNSVTIDVALDLQAGQRLMMWIRVITGEAFWDTFYFGDEDHDSNIQYLGNAPYIPENSTYMVLPLFMLATFLVAMVYRRRRPSTIS